MDYQTAFNYAIGLSAFFAGVLINALRESVKSLHESDEHLAMKVQSIEVLVAGQYVKRDDLDRHIVAIFTKLDRIEQKLDTKVDK